MVPPTPSIPERPGSRRRRPWELGSPAHCPVIWVCRPLPAVHRLAANRATPTQQEAVMEESRVLAGQGPHCERTGKPCVLSCEVQLEAKR